MYDSSQNEKVIIALFCISIIIGSLIHYYKIIRPDTYTDAQEWATKDLMPSKIININTAEEKDLIRLEGIGSELAKRIISYRNEIGSFNSKEEITNVKGLGNKKFNKIKDFITCQ